MNQESSNQGNVPPPAEEMKTPWYAGVTRYQWMVLAIASAGWVFDVFEGQLFGSCMHQALPVLLAGTGMEEMQETFVNIGLAAFLAGGAVGGLLFGMLADRWGRKKVMALTILMYSVFTGLTAVSQTWWQLIILRFLVGMGVGGEWSVAAAVVAEVFPARARPAASGIFHASSVLGTYLAVAAGLLVGTLTVMDRANGWRYGFLLGVIPALLILWVRVSMREPETWQSAKRQADEKKTAKLGRVTDLFTTPTLLRNTLVGTSLAIIGLATFWGSHFRGRDVVRQAAAKEFNLVGGPAHVIAQSLGAQALAPIGGPLPAATQAVISTKSAESKIDAATIQVNRYAMFAWFLVTTGGGIGLLSFAPISQAIGRRMAFAFFHAGGLVFTVVVYFLAGSVTGLLIILPIFGFFTLAMHAGYAVYFPELYPTRLRSTGTGFCFNIARVVVVPVLLLFAWLQDGLGLQLIQAMLVLGGLFVVGIILSFLGPETRGQPLPE